MSFFAFWERSMFGFVFYGNGRLAWVAGLFVVIISLAFSVYGLL
jgi:hypothetical protein